MVLIMEIVLKIISIMENMEMVERIMLVVLAIGQELDVVGILMELEVIIIMIMIHFLEGMVHMEVDLLCIHFFLD